MAPKKFLFCTAAVLFCVLIFNLQRAEGCGDFQATCKDFGISSSGEFSAHCKNDGGSYKDTSINLNDFISNDDGTMVAGSDFAATCNNLGWNNGGSAFYINADCAKPDGSYDSTSYELSNSLSNTNGILTWC